MAFGAWLITPEAPTEIPSAPSAVLIDTGFEPSDIPQGWNVLDYRDIITGLEQAGSSAEAIGDIVLTHSHWDHVGGVHHFPNARIWITPATLDRLHKSTSKSAQRTFRALMLAEKAGLLRRVRGRRNIRAGITVVPVGLHTHGFQYVLLRNGGEEHSGYWVFASDLAPLKANFIHAIPSRQTTDRSATKELLLNWRALVGEHLTRLIPGHDASVFGKSDIVEYTN